MNICGDAAQHRRHFISNAKDQIATVSFVARQEPTRRKAIPRKTPPPFTMKTPISTSCDIRLPRSGLRPLVSICLVAIAAHANWALAADDGLLNGFNNPPSTAKPLVWWHWMNGNVTQDGIAKDLAWMKRVGIGGLQHFDAGLVIPQIVDKRLVYMTFEWKDAFRFTAQEVDRLGLELTIVVLFGWSETDGP